MACDPGDGTREMVLQKFLVLDVDPAFEAVLSLTPIVRRSRKANAALGVTGLATTANGLPLSHERLFALCNERWQPARGGVVAWDGTISGYALGARATAGMPAATLVRSRSQ